MILLGQTLLDFRSNGVNLRANGLVRAAALLLSHKLSIVDGGVYFLEAVSHIALESGRDIRVVEGVADAGGAGLKWCTVAREGSHLVRSYAGFGRAVKG